jgi:hypothetical protein
MALNMSASGTAQPLVPRVVGRPEVLVDRIAGRQLLCVEVTDQSPGGPGVLLAEPPDQPLLGDVLPPGDGVGPVAADQLGQRVGDAVL